MEDKSNEIPAVQDLIELLYSAGAVLTTNAIHCQTQTAKAIVAKQADYIMIVKGNQPILQEALHETILKAMDSRQSKMRRRQTRDSKRGRNDLREVVFMTAPTNCPILAQWAVVKSIGVIYGHRENNGEFEESSERFLSNLNPKVRDLSKRIREHWGIENQQHYILDVTFPEDASRIRKENSPEISSVFRRLPLSVLRRDTTIKDNIRG